jgi:hypothetical protein
LTLATSNPAFLHAALPLPVIRGGESRDSDLLDTDEVEWLDAIRPGAATGLE